MADSVTTTADVAAPVQATASTETITPAVVETKAPEAEDKAAKVERFNAMTARKEAEAKARKEFETEKSLIEKKNQKFDSDNDPDGSKEMDTKAEVKVQELLDKRLKELGLDDTLNQIKTENIRKDFLGKMESVNKEFSKLGIKSDMNTIANTLVEFEKEPTLSHQELFLLSHQKEIMAALSAKKGFTPGAGTTPADTSMHQPKSHEELVDSILAKHGH